MSDLIFQLHSPIVLLITGALKAGEVIWSQKYKWITFGWILFLLTASIMLITYNEPEGSYQKDGSPKQ